MLTDITDKLSELLGEPRSSILRTGYVHLSWLINNGTHFAYAERFDDLGEIRISVYDRDANICFNREINSYDDSYDIDMLITDILVKLL